MAIYHRYKIMIFIILTLTSAWVLWNFSLKEIYYNLKFRSEKVTNLEKSKVYHLKKLDLQQSIYGFEMEINGHSNQNIQLVFGPKNDRQLQSVSIKKGNIDFEYAQDWYAEECYLIFPSNSGAKVDLEIKYRFLGSSH